MPESIIEIPPRPTVTRLPDPPSSADPNNFDPRADDYLDAQYQYSEELNVLAGWVEDVSAVVRTLAQGTADDAVAVAQAEERVGALERSATASAEAAKAYAQAAGASSGVPEPIASKWFGADENANPGWYDPPKDATKLDKKGGVATALGQPSKDHGVIPAGGIVVVDVSVASIHKIQAAGSIEIQFTGWAGADVSQEVELHCVNFGGKTQKWAPGLWVKSDRTRVPEVGNAGINWLTAGQNDVLVRHDFGANVYVAM